MAKTKAGGSTKLGRDSRSKRLGIKLHDGEKVKPGDIIVRQRGSAFRPGKNVRQGSDDTLYATHAGFVKFGSRLATSFTGRRKTHRIVNVLPKRA